jgi:hypothetical protein
MEYEFYSMLAVAVRYWLLSQITIKSISASVTLSHHGDGAISMTSPVFEGKCVINDKLL